MPTIAISDFVRRQTVDSEFSCFAGSDEELLNLVHRNFDGAKPGYRDGVVLVPVDPTLFLTAVVELKEGDQLVGFFKARQPGETPRKSFGVVGGQKTPAKFVDIVLYRADVLAEGEERSSDAEWEIISINARATEGDQPIAVDALMANHFGADGGTATGMTDSEFVAALRESFNYWKSKMLVAPKGAPTLCAVYAKCSVRKNQITTKR
jgi:hypothetical protein